LNRKSPLLQEEILLPHPRCSRPLFVPSDLLQRPSESHLEWHQLYGLVESEFANRERNWL
jgi:hypothetical protein